MTSWIIALVAIVSTTACLFLQFRDVLRFIREQKSIVKSAAGQLAVCREKSLKARDGPEVSAVLDRSEKIYRQAVDLYNQTLHKAWNYFPAHLMGLRYIIC